MRTLLSLLAIAVALAPDFAAADTYVVTTSSGSYTFAYPENPPGQSGVPRINPSGGGVACGANKSQGYGCNFVGGGQFNQMADEYRVAAENQIEGYRNQLAAELKAQDSQVSPDGVIPELKPLKDEVTQIRDSLNALAKELKDAHTSYEKDYEQRAQANRPEKDPRLTPAPFNRLVMKENPELNAFATSLVVNGASLFPHGIAMPAGELPPLPSGMMELGIRLGLDGTPLHALPDLFELTSGHSIAPPFEELSNAQRALAAVGLITVNRVFWEKAAETYGSFSKAVVETLDLTFGQERLALLDAIESTSLGTQYYGPLFRGPLEDLRFEGPGLEETGKTVADTFRSSTYYASVTKEPVVLYRVYSDDVNWAGRYWTRTRPTGPLQATIDAALHPGFRNSAARWVAIEVPPGTVLYDGLVAPIVTPTKTFLGNGAQTVLNVRVTEDWIVGKGTF